MLNLWLLSQAANIVARSNTKVNNIQGIIYFLLTLGYIVYKLLYSFTNINVIIKSHYRNAVNFLSNSY